MLHLFWRHLLMLTLKSISVLFKFFWMDYYSQNKKINLIKKNLNIIFIRFFFGIYYIFVEKKKSFTEDSLNLCARLQQKAKCLRQKLNLFWANLNWFCRQSQGPNQDNEPSKSKLEIPFKYRKYANY
ncbi:hypothetical protein BpHYR1_034313 [Brachionus plicatilis]|uniref:Transmembrane protein n=1 Tax=Brachionus plicatilis TaxID=10195 RepID=A0A3M7RV02_BRAPC|nr:hypothetical protein BpHYR1_034313 [Brachionus plicatilis]